MWVCILSVEQHFTQDMSRIKDMVAGSRTPGALRNPYEGNGALHGWKSLFSKDWLAQYPEGLILACIYICILTYMYSYAGLYDHSFHLQ